VLTIGMERNLTKKRILELYLNVAEFGRGIYGVEAAARHYWGISASKLSAKQAIQLAATLSAPVNHNPATKTEYFNQRIKKISRYF
ncbi:MAG: transglycosylase domain-containing protein, partial [Gammaproteobacteria bacterium]|nr:transglycosylase domain-containing protein [Gammaproteobacteria bacterium]